MIEIKPISTTDSQSYDFVEKLFLSAFPEEERREIELQREFTDNNPAFVNNVITDENKPVGFISYWLFDDCIYIEHFAISPETRSNGYGRKALQFMKEKFSLPIVLEVELPTNELSKRRVEFYKRQDYVLWNNEYVQPPYRKGGKSIPMCIMAYGKIDPNKDFERIKQKLYKEVYLV